MQHKCHWPSCDKEVPPKHWGCIDHWFMLPQGIRNEIWCEYRPGQEVDKQPSHGYLCAADKAQFWARGFEAGYKQLVKERPKNELLDL